MSSSNFCDRGCPFGGEGRICGQSPYDCPIEAMYRELLQRRAGDKHCAYCSLHRSDPDGNYPANLCGQCGRFCPACSAPKS